MKLARVRNSDGSETIASWEGDELLPLDLSQVENCNSLSDILHAPDPKGLATFLVDPQGSSIDAAVATLLAPIDRQEVWAAGVTYKRRQVARMEESESGASHYDKVYTADRPELFMKATPARVSGPGEALRVRKDSEWSVPEPELGLVVNPEMKIVGYTVGNDMSARDIEGENPLYLPQAKVYDQCCGLGPCVFLADDDYDTTQMQIELTIERDGAIVFNGATAISEMARSLPGLVEWLGRENTLPDGAILLTGTGIVPNDDFTLINGDSVSISITDIGTLTNPIVKD